MSILNHFPAGLTPRPLQRDVLLDIEKNWNRADVFSVVLPTAAGKTEISLCVANWVAAQGKGAAITAPTNILCEQTKERYPELTIMRKKSFYRCDTYKKSCHDTFEAEEAYCGGCKYKEASKEAQDAKVVLGNLYVYFAHKLHRDTLIIDEAHTVIPMMEGKADFKLAHTEYQYPPDLKTVADVVAWAQRKLKRGEDEALQEMVDVLVGTRSQGTVVYRTETIGGRKQKILHVIGEIKQLSEWWLWPRHKVKKIVLLSATLNAIDMKELGLDMRRVHYIEAPSPIPAERRPVVYRPSYNLSFKYVDLALPLLAQKVEETLAKHPGEKGLLHLPYGLAARLMDLTSNPRLLFHTNKNKAAVLERFKASDPSEGLVLVASGLYEGISMDEDLARFQIIGKVPFLSLADPKIEAKAKAWPDWYTWMAAKTMIQATGRIVRSPEDFGTTYIFDSNFGRLLQQDARRKQPMFPKFFRDAVRTQKP